MDMEEIYDMTVEFKRRSMQSMAVLMLLAVVGAGAVGETDMFTYQADIPASRTAGIIGRIIL